jgi:FkbH-like protein
MKETVLFERPRAEITVSAEVLASFNNFATLVTARSQIVWGEHCSECAYPSCYSSCAFYTPRGDMNCRRFEAGIESVTSPEATRSSLTRIRFRKWGKLEGRGPAHVRPLGAVRRFEILDGLVSGALHGLPSPYWVARGLNRRWNGRKVRHGARYVSVESDAFVMEAVSLDGSCHPFTVTFLQSAGHKGRMYQDLLQIGPAYGRLVIDAKRISKHVDLKDPFLVQVEPVGDGSGIDILFGFVDFACFPGVLPPSISGVARTFTESGIDRNLRAKVVVWDLDNTLWAGTLAEDGIAGVTLRSEAVALIKALDDRGILHSIASKNDELVAMAALRELGLLQFFLVPQINWSPKSDSVRRIAKQLNLGTDSFVLIDDQAFERAEVRAAHPKIITFPDTAIADLFTHSLFDVPATIESRQRRSLYQAEAQRGACFQSASTDYNAFLRSCLIRLDVVALDRVNVERIYELSQRTNQLNFRGTKYSRADVEALAMNGSSSRQTYVLRCADRFGEYGIVGFAVLDLNNSMLLDFFMSCRVQRKFVEHAFFEMVARDLRQRNHSRMRACFRHTERNKASVNMLRELGFSYTEKEPGAGEWIRDLSTPFADADIVQIDIEAPHGVKEEI